MIQIAWDSKRCTSPQDCRVCLDGCPQGVFNIFPKDGRVEGKVTERWAIGALFVSLCTGCRICEDICPVKAIAVGISS